MERTRLIRLEIRKKEKLEILLDEAFGGLVKKMKDKKVLNSIVIVSNDDLTLERKIRKYVEDAGKKL